MQNVDLLALVLQTPKCLPPIVWGPAGIGKTALSHQLAAVFDAHMEVVISSIRDPADFGGLPIPEPEEGVRLEPPAWARRLAKICKDKDGKLGRRGFAFLDEASCAPPAVQSALLRVVFERVVGDLQLPESVQFIAAANPPDQAAGGWDLALPLANRFIHLQWGAPSADAWTDWLCGSNQALSVPTLDQGAWSKQWGQAKALVTAYMKRRPGMLAEEPEKVRGRFPLAYATPRTWEAAVRLLATCRAVAGGEDLVLPLMTATLGEPHAVEFCTWLRANDLPDPEHLLAAPAAWEPNPAEPDRVFAACLALCDAALSEGNGKPYTTKEKHHRWQQAWRCFGRVMPFGKDLVGFVARKMSSRMIRPKKQDLDADVIDVIKELGEVVQMSGI